jgi:hypothetical protein
MRVGRRGRVQPCTSSVSAPRGVRWAGPSSWRWPARAPGTPAAAVRALVPGGSGGGGGAAGRDAAQARPPGRYTACWGRGHVRWRAGFSWCFRRSAQLSGNDWPIVPAERSSAVRETGETLRNAGSRGAAGPQPPGASAEACGSPSPWSRRPGDRRPGTSIAGPGRPAPGRDRPHSRRRRRGRRVRMGAGSAEWVHLPRRRARAGTLGAGTGALA